MSARILYIDFASGEMALELGPDLTGRAMDRLDALLESCGGRGLGPIRLYCRPGMTNLQVLVLNELCQRHGASLEQETEQPRPPAGDDSLVSHGGGETVAAGAPLEYRVRLQALDRAATRMTTAAILVGQASGLDEVSRGHLRLFAYELVLNSVEHGRFRAEMPEIRMDITLSDSGITLSYRDNADIFMTGNHLLLDVEQKIESGDKRGLGLFIINKLARSFDYRRLGDWNVTTLTMNAHHDDAHGSQRRPEMQGVTVEVIPCDLPGAVILKPAGSVDSTSTQLLESQIESLIEKDHSRIVIDFSNVDFISSAGVGIFLGTVSRLRNAGGDLFFMHMPKHIEDVFDIINLKSYFITIDSVDQIETADRS